MNIGEIQSSVHCTRCDMLIEVYPEQEIIECTYCNENIDLKINFDSYEQI